MTAVGLKYIYYDDEKNLKKKEEVDRMAKCCIVTNDGSCTIKLMYYTNIISRVNVIMLTVV